MYVSSDLLYYSYYFIGSGVYFFLWIEEFYVDMHRCMSFPLILCTTKWALLIFRTKTFIGQVDFTFKDYQCSWLSSPFFFFPALKYLFIYARSGRYTYQVSYTFSVVSTFLKLKKKCKRKDVLERFTLLIDMTNARSCQDLASSSQESRTSPMFPHWWQGCKDLSCCTLLLRVQVSNS